MSETIYNSMKLKIAGVIMACALVVLGAAIFRLHTKEPATPVVIITPDIRPKPPEPITVPIVEPVPVIPVIVYPPLEVKQGHIIKR